MAKGNGSGYAAERGGLDWQARSTGRERRALMDEVTANIPLGEIPGDGDCARAVLFFGSDYSKVVAGAALDVNGGEYMPI